MKLKQFQKYLREQQIDLAFLIHPDINITYFTQIKPSFAFLVINQGSASLYLTKLDQRHNFKQISIKTINENWENKLMDKKIKKVGLNYASITVAYFRKLKKIFPKAKFVDISRELLGLRERKIPDEVKKIKHACRITDISFQELVNELDKKKLKTEQDIALFLERKMQELNAEPAFPTIVAMGKNAAAPHYQTGKQKLKRGFLLIDFGACCKNYCSDMSRVLFLGTMKKIEMKLYNLLLETQIKSLQRIKEGVALHELEEFARKRLGDHSSYFIHSLGHGLGLEVHEQPSFSKEQGKKIASGQVFTIEPGIYLPQKFGLRIEDTLLFDRKAEILTNSAKKLIKIRL